MNHTENKTQQKNGYNLPWCSLTKKQLDTILPKTNRRKVKSIEDIDWKKLGRSFKRVFNKLNTDELVGKYDNGELFDFIKKKIIKQNDTTN